jgi:hypothetical protein
LKLKPGVRVLGLKPEILTAMLVAESIIGDAFVITAAVDSNHKAGSKHFSGMAFDFRTNDLPTPMDTILKLREALGAEFDVLLEDPGLPNSHGHIEYDPKTGVNQ